MQNNTIVILNRDVDALLIPSGSPIYLQQGTEVMITQELGDAFTVNIYGNLARIDGKDADALGRNVKPAFTELPPGMSLEDFIWEQLKTCYDPEIPVNIVDLGLIYGCELNSVGEDFQVQIKMTLTAPACGMGPVLTADVQRKIAALPHVQSVTVDLVFDPPWDRSRISEAGQLQLGIF